MNFIGVLLIAIGLSMDAFAVAISTGLALRKATLKNMFVVGAYFGGFQAGMPVLGYLAATFFADLIIAYDHWVAFALLSFLGGKMIVGSFKKEKERYLAEKNNNKQNEESAKYLQPKEMLPLALATSIDALAVGVSFAFLRVSIIPAAVLIGLITLAISMLGIRIGTIFGTKFKSKAEFAGGAILILIGVSILIEHLG